MAKIKTIRSVERAVQVLEFLQADAPASLEDVHRGTGLPRATAARVLLTLLAQLMAALHYRRVRDPSHLSRQAHLVGVIFKREFPCPA
ncbi:MAG: helix-turn-helix domain-containing protein [Gammaproteobacteria bacterium]|nr:helix-turn-helix domain-containing protein [Gammaproteobacteria bacterium]